jgi:hypothetical protein
MPTPTTNPEAPNHGSNSNGPHNLKEVALTGWKPGMTWRTSQNGKETNFGLWRTPSAQEPGISAERLVPIEGGTLGGMNRHFDKHTGRMAQIGLEQQVKLRAMQWPTPTAHNSKEGAYPAEFTRNTPTLSAQAGGTLNPTWVEKLMGWPDDWTSLQPISHVKMCFWVMGMHDGTEARTIEVLRMLRNGDVTQEVQRAIGRPVGISETAFLLAELCEHANQLDEARVFMACAEALEEEVRGVQLCDGPTSSSHRPEQDKQRTGEHPDAMQALSRLLAHYGKAAWKSGSWEDAIPRIAHGVAARVDRLKAIGNGQPQNPKTPVELR